jgi:ketosteroid isomerase-like protein
MTRTLLAAALLALMVTSMVHADDADAEKQVGKVAEQAREAAVKGDTEAMDGILADDWMVIQPNGNVVSKAQYTRAFKDGDMDFESYEPSEVKVRVYGDAAVVTGRAHVKMKWKGEKVDDHVRISEFYAKQGGKWRCVSTQVTSIAGQAGAKR